MNASRPLSSFALPCEGIRTTSFKNAVEAINAVKSARRLGVPVIPLGAGTNCVFLEPKLPVVFLQSRNKTIAVKRVTNNKKQGTRKTLVTAGAGLSWDELVKFTVQHNLQGLECLSGIPSTCGAAPVQNIGAYGTELAATLQSVEALNLKTLRRQKLSRKQCEFGYRRSIFNTTERGTFLILSITLALTPSRTARQPKYPGFANLTNRDTISPRDRISVNCQPSLAAVRRAVLRVRRKKLPDYKTTPNCGSFFKNPIVSPATAAKILKRHPSLPHWPEPDGNVKLSAAWLIDAGGLRKRHWGKIHVSPYHALILVNEGDRNHQNIRRAIQEIRAVVRNTFGVTIETEPNLIDRKFVSTFKKNQNLITKD
jgi:UDP-N-acetylmuramate dehydrogenase